MSISQKKMKTEHNTEQEEPMEVDEVETMIPCNCKIQTRVVFDYKLHGSLTSAPQVPCGYWSLLHAIQRDKEKSMCIFKDSYLLLRVQYELIHTCDDTISTTRIQHVDILGGIRFCKQKANFSKHSIVDKNNDVSCYWQNYPSLSWMCVVFSSCVLYALPAHAASTLSFGRSTKKVKGQEHILHLQSGTVNAGPLVFLCVEAIFCTNRNHDMQLMNTCTASSCPRCCMPVGNNVVWECPCTDCELKACSTCILSQGKGMRLPVDIQCVKIEKKDTIRNVVERFKTHTVVAQDNTYKHSQLEARRVERRL